MKILLPLNGLGIRFEEKGYTEYKPFIKVHGEPIIIKVIESLGITNEELFIITRKEFKKYNFESFIKKHFSKININVIYLNNNTSGPAETLLEGLKLINEEDFEFLAVDGDTVYQENIISKINHNISSVFYFETSESLPLYSYITLDENSNITNIAEKNKISNLANTGAYFFKSSKEFISFATEVVCNSLNKESYTSLVYLEMLKENIKIKGIQIKNFCVLGTPLQLQNYCINNLPKKQLRFVFDLDNTLVTFPVVPNDYSSVNPIISNINFLNYLKSLGHYIIIYTARRMKTHNGNVSKVIADIAEITLQTLKKFNINYDEICFGKPYADFYIDDLSINPLKDNLEYTTGFYNANYTETRPFNRVLITDKYVEKTGNICGEVFWYNNCPFYILEKYFPKILKANNETIKMEKIEGLSLSYLYINNLLNENILSKLLISINKIHNFTSTTKGDFNKNYYFKILQRYNSNLSLYNKFSDSITRLKEFEIFFKEYSCTNGNIIHGDPVFSNTFLTTKEDIKFIDVRGMNGESFSLYGDSNYDYAKIYQSIIGYDFILHDKPINISQITEYSKLFFSKIEELKKDPEQIKNITKSLIFSMLPLHENFNKVKKYYELLALIDIF